MIKIILADDHPAVISGVRQYIDLMPGYAVVAAATSTAELSARLQDTPCDMLISEFSLPINRIGDGCALFNQLKREYPAIALIVLTTLDIPAVLYQITNSGVSGVVHKSDDMNELGRAVMEGSFSAPYVSKAARLLLKKGPSGKAPTRREVEVLKMYVVGNSLREIAVRLHKSVKTVGLQKASAMRKMGLRNDVELGRYSCTMGRVNLARR
ncbi:two-component system capsular synthesis response regulator RcsB [Collimonas sp. PA-H2]|uniref:response regulator transcription factor n=1 Tax=Collimonas sp. PA-H2 TaxID=1881062 RepID=UPI000BF9B5F4|nr:response regulator transcription factor [Collimonas sp. PA-H2]PFH09621.1 two-component system capsular synthesis response regulator RcsB [Collimonas sp. PA-H2]